MTTRRGRPKGTKLTDRVSFRVTADHKIRIETFCLEANLLQKEFVLMAIDEYFTNTTLKNPKALA